MKKFTYIILVLSLSILSFGSVGAELHIWPDTAHWPMIDAPDRVAKVILDRY